MYDGKMALRRLLNNDFYRLSVFLVPIAFAELAVDVAEQVLNRSIAKGEDVVEVLAGFGLAYVFAKFFVGVLGEAKQASLVLVHDRWTFFKTMIYFLVCGVFVFVLLLVTALTQLGVWLIQDLHGVSPRVTDQARLALALLAFYPTIDLISWYHAGLLMQYHHSTVVGIASLADIAAQIVSVAGLVFTPLLCNNTIAIPIIAAYCGVIVRCVINVAACYKMTFKLLSPKTTSPVSLWRLTTFISPLMLALAVQRISRPIVNLLVARSVSTPCAADTAVAVLTACYPVGRLPYGWLNQLRAVPPAFTPKSDSGENVRKRVKGWKIGVFVTIALVVAVIASIILFWVPGVSVIIMRDVVGVSEYLALLCVNPLRIFSLFCFTVSTRASLTGWLTLHRQTKLVIPGTGARLVAILTSLFTLPLIGVTGALMGTVALFSGFSIEAIFVLLAASIYAVWKRYGTQCKCRKQAIGKEEVDDVIPLSDLPNHEEEELTTNGEYSSNTDDRLLL